MIGVDYEVFVPIRIAVDLCSAPMSNSSGNADTKGTIKGEYYELRVSGGTEEDYDILHSLIPEEVLLGSTEYYDVDQDFRSHPTFYLSEPVDLALFKAKLPRIEFFGPELRQSEDWLAVWRKSYQSFEFIQGLFIVPSWHEPESDWTSYIRIDPGLAFGTGQHETTRGVATLMKSLSSENIRTFLDIGCGSGILGITARKIFPDLKDLVCIDNDVEALRVSKENFALNNVSYSEISDRSLESIDQKFDLIVCNIISTTLLQMRKIITYLAGRNVILSGVLVEEESFIGHWLNDFDLVSTLPDGVWVSFLLRRK